MKITKEIKVALLVLVSIALLLWGYNFLKGKNLFDNSRKFYVEYENVEGLSTASFVTINGLNVGKVSNITIQPSGKLLVELTMTNPVEIPKASKAIIYSPALIGGKQIAIETNFSSKELAETGDFLIASNKSGLLDGLGEKADPIIQKLDSVLYNVNKLVVSVNNTLDPVAQSNLKHALLELDHTLTNARGITDRFNQIVGGNQNNIDQIIGNFNAASLNINKMSENLSQADINGIVQKFDRAANNIDRIVADIDKGDGSIGKLLKDEELYDNINKASNELNQLVEDVKLNPSRYVNISVFGRKPGPYVTPDTLKR